MPSAASSPRLATKAPVSPPQGRVGGCGFIRARLDRDSSPDSDTPKLREPTNITAAVKPSSRSSPASSSLSFPSYTTPSLFLSRPLGSRAGGSSSRGRQRSFTSPGCCSLTISSALRSLSPSLCLSSSLSLQHPGIAFLGLYFSLSSTSNILQECPFIRETPGVICQPEPHMYTERRASHFRFSRYLSIADSFGLISS